MSAAPQISAQPPVPTAVDSSPLRAKPDAPVEQVEALRLDRCGYDFWRAEPAMLCCASAEALARVRLELRESREALLAAEARQDAAVAAERERVTTLYESRIRGALSAAELAAMVLRGG